jgi:hypothetical protein
LVSFRRVFAKGVDYNIAAVPTAKEEHSFHLMELRFSLVLLPDGVAVFTDRIANLTKEETAHHR